MLASEDSDAFDAVMDSFGLPKSTDDEKDARRTAIRSAMMAAASVPLKRRILCSNNCPNSRGSGNANAVTDVGVAGFACQRRCKRSSVQR